MERNFEWLWDKYKEGARNIFEEVCYKIYKRQYPDAEVKRVRVHQGDGGIDVYIEGKEEYTVVQCKFFRDSISDSQKNQIRTSFEAVDKENLSKWILSIPIIMSEREALWWRRWKKEKETEFDIKIQLHDEDDLIDFLKQNNLYDDYFDTVRIDKNFIDSVVGNDEKKIIHDRLYPLISSLSNGHYDMYDIVVQVETMLDLTQHRIFNNNHLLLYLNELTDLYSIHAEGHGTYGKQLRSTQKIEEETELRKKIVEEYKNLGL